MDIGILAARRQIAIEKIEEKTEIDISQNVLPKANGIDLFQLFQLEKLAKELPDKTKLFKVDEIDTLENILHIIFNINGVGPALFKKIEKALREV